MTTEEMKLQVLKDMANMLAPVRKKVEVLDALDQDTTADGCMDLHDQLQTMWKELSGLEAVVVRSMKVTGE